MKDHEAESQIHPLWLLIKGGGGGGSTRGLTMNDHGAQTWATNSGEGTH